jgi:hypothetical protein
MGIRFLDEIAKDLEKKDKIKLPNDSITGTEFEKWLYETDGVETEKSQ